MRTLPILVAALVLSALGAGCIENLRDLQDKVGGAKAEADKAEALAKQGIDLVSANATKANATGKPPVARIAIYGLNGALVYKASFVGEDVAGPVVIDENVTLTLVATDSEALGSAKIVSYAWDLAGKPASGSKASATFAATGVYPIVLNVTDSNGNSDTQTVVVGVPPKPFDVANNVTITQTLGASGAGQEGGASFEVKLSDAKVDATIQQVVVKVPAVDTCDFAILVLDKEDKVVGKSDNAGVGGGEAAVMPALPEGSYKIAAMPGDACVTLPDGFPASVVTTFLPIVPGFGAGDGHGHHH